MRQIYTRYGDSDILRRRNSNGLVSDALASSEPMRELIARHLPDRLIDEFAREINRGRGLFVVTSNLDTGRAWVWDMGPSRPRVREICSEA